jgi:beta-lactam-binding protein with PASTA domain
VNRRSILVSGLAAAGAAVVVIAIVASSGGFGMGTRHVVPELRGQRLDLAEARLDTIGLDSDTKGGGTFGVVVRSHWEVCDEQPRPGVTASSVLLVVARECQWSVPNVVGLRLKEAETRLDREETPYSVSYPAAVRRLRHQGRFDVCAEEPQDGPATEPVVLSVNRICELPDLTRVSLAKAHELLLGSDVLVKAFDESGQQVSKGRWEVCEQDMTAGAPADQVRLTVYQTCELPDVTGASLAEALRQMRAAHVAVTARDGSGRRVSTGKWWVCNQDPSGYEPASRVTLRVGPRCRGAASVPDVPSPNSSALPYLEGYSLDYARTSLDNIGVFYRVIVSRASTGLDDSLLEVCHQTPQMGEGVAPGGRAVLYVAGDCYTEWPDDFRR